MNRLKFRRVTAITAGALIGLAGVATFAAPASAHHSIVSGTACELKSGALVIDWTVANSENDLAGKITEVWTPSGATISGIAVGMDLPKSTDGGLKGRQVLRKVERTSDAAELKISAEWIRDGRQITNTATGTATLTGACAWEEPSSSPTPEPTASPTAEPTTPAPTTEPSTPAPSSPAPTSAAPTPQPSEPSGPLVPEEPNAPIFEIISSCDALTVTADNPTDGMALTLVFTTEKGETKKLELIPGKKTEVSFEAYDGLTITPSLEGEKGDPKDAVKWTHPPKCDEGQGGGLPVTGAAAGGIAAGAVLLLAAGAILFVVARRRRVRFTA